MTAVKILCWMLTALAGASIAAYGLFDVTVVAPMHGDADVARGMICVVVHLGALLAGPASITDWEAA